MLKVNFLTQSRAEGAVWRKRKPLAPRVPGSREQGTGDREQGTGDREQGPGDKEQVTGNR